MNFKDWHQLLTTARQNPRTPTQLEAPASELDLRAVEALLGCELPSPYRSFLAAADGGWLGDRYIYGTRELRRMLVHAVASEAPQLLPFHPVDRHGVECLELAGTGRVFWCHSAEDTPRFVLDRQHPLADRIASGRSTATQEATYVDFTDWALDALHEAATGHAQVAMPSLN